MTTQYNRNRMAQSMTDLEVQNYLSGKVKQAQKDGRKVIRVFSVATDAKLRETRQLEKVIIGGFFRW
ncbi:hypothetical protein [Leclercia sp.]|uniref:DUF7540 domain-containing protein n=1 Tax=Leclercia sp. TaxID=1898428 RepID=UPI0028AC6DB1|nr:hypothetical protein [Leclercia sp.]